MKTGISISVIEQRGCSGRCPCFCFVQRPKDQHSWLQSLSYLPGCLMDKVKDLPAKFSSPLAVEKNCSSQQAAAAAACVLPCWLLCFLGKLAKKIANGNHIIAGHLGISSNIQIEIIWSGNDSAMFCNGQKCFTGNKAPKPLLNKWSRVEDYLYFVQFDCQNTKKLRYCKECREE